MPFIYVFNRVLALAIKYCSNAYLLVLEHGNIMRINKPMRREKKTLPYSTYGPLKMAINPQIALHLCFYRLLAL